VASLDLLDVEADVADIVFFVKGKHPFGIQQSRHGDDRCRYLIESGRTLPCCR
jgi:hypothetical protein